jgi:hypothetical protein
MQGLSRWQVHADDLMYVQGALAASGIPASLPAASCAAYVQQHVRHSLPMTLLLSVCLTVSAVSIAGVDIHLLKLEAPADAVYGCAHALYWYTPMLSASSGPCVGGAAVHVAVAVLCACTCSLALNVAASFVLKPSARRSTVWLQY